MNAILIMLLILNVLFAFLNVVPGLSNYVALFNAFAAGIMFELLLIKLMDR